MKTLNLKDFCYNSNLNYNKLHPMLLATLFRKNNDGLLLPSLKAEKLGIYCKNNKKYYEEIISDTKYFYTKSIGLKTQEILKDVLLSLKLREVKLIFSDDFNPIYLNLGD